jgi:hypothetical protein
MLNAGYHQLVRPIQRSPQLGGLVERCVERDFLVDIDRTPGTGPTAQGALGLFVFWDQPRGTAAGRTAIRDRLHQVLLLNEPTDAVSLRERILSGLRDIIEAALGRPVVRNATRPIPLDDSTAAHAVFVDGGHDADYEQLTGEPVYRLAFTVELYSGEPDPSARDVFLDEQERAVRAALIERSRVDGIDVWIDEESSDVEVDATDATAPSADRLFRGVVEYTEDIVAVLGLGEPEAIAGGLGAGMGGAGMGGAGG